MPVADWPWYHVRLRCASIYHYCGKYLGLPQNELQTNCNSQNLYQRSHDTVPALNYFIETKTVFLHCIALHCFVLFLVICLIKTHV